MTYESAIFIEPKIVFGEIQPLLEINFSLFQIHRKKPYPLLNVLLDFRISVTDGTEYEWPSVGHPPDREGTQQGQDFQEGKFSSLSDLSRVIPL